MYQNSSLWDAFPWIELHVHLRGALSPQFLFHQLEKNKGSLSIGEAHLALFDEVAGIRDILVSNSVSKEQVEKLLKPEDLRSFLLTYLFTGYLIQSVSDFEALVADVVRSFSMQSHQYVEISVSLFDYLREGIPLEELIAILCSYRDRRKPIVRWILDPVRNSGPEKALALLQRLSELPEQAFSGITLGGMEDSYPTSAFHPVYARAYDMGLGTSIHAGETGSAQSVVDCLSLPGLTRIGHGLSALYDADATISLIEHGITLEVCPLGNIFTGLVADVSKHPVLESRHPGLNVTINTDDPSFFHNSMKEEFLQLERHAYPRESLIQCQYQAINAAFCSQETKSKLHMTLDSYLGN